MVIQVEDLGETGAGGQFLVPGAFGALRVEQVFDAVLYAQTVVVSAGNETHQGPGGLGRSALGRGKGAVVITGAAFAPTAIGVLDGAQPLAAAQNVGFAIAFPGGCQPPQGEAGAVDVGHAPPSVPASVGLLMTNQPIHSAADRSMVAVYFVSRQRFQHAPGNVRAGGIEHGIVVSEGNLVEELPIVVGVESGPAAVGRLHGK